MALDLATLGYDTKTMCYDYRKGSHFCCTEGKGVSFVDVGLVEGMGEECYITFFFNGFFFFNLNHMGFFKILFFQCSKSLLSTIICDNYPLMSTRIMWPIFLWAKGMVGSKAFHIEGILYPKLWGKSVPGVRRTAMWLEWLEWARIIKEMK